MTNLTLLTRNGCHLCDEMKTVIMHVQHAHNLVLTEIDLVTRPDLEQQFGTEVPVLLRGAILVARHRITETQLIAAVTT